MKCACVVLSYVDRPAVQYFSTLSHKLYVFRKNKVVEYNMCFYVFSVQFLSATFIVLGRTERDVVKNVGVYWSSCKVPVILVRF